MKRTILIFLVIILFACASVSKAEAKKNKRPEWLDNPQKIYPEAYYLSAIGEGDSRAYAEDMAVSKISRIFESVVKTEQTVSNRYNEIVNAKGANATETTDINTNINISSEQKLLNLKFGESYTDKNGRVFVIAYIDRMKTASIYESRIEAAAAKIVEFLKNGDNAKNRIESYAYYNAAVLFHEQIQIMMQQLDIIFPSGKDMIELGYDENILTKKLKEAADKITFNIDLENDKDGKIRILLQEMFTDMGFKLNDDALLKVKGKIDFYETDLKRDDYIFVRYDMKLQIVDDHNEIVAALSEKGREGHTSYSEAEARCVQKLQTKINKKLKRKIVNYFDNLVK